VQEFVGLVPALAAFSLPCVAVGPAYQIINADGLGTYSGSQHTYGYASLMGGAIVDLSELADDEALPATKKPISVQIKSAQAEIVPATATGAGSNTAFADVTSGIFDDVLAGDLLVIVPTTGVSIVGAQTNGKTYGAQRTRLEAGVAGQFANVRAGDSVLVTAGTNVTPGTYLVAIKASSSLLILDGNIGDGVGDSTDAAYSITGARGASNAGNWRVKSKTDANNLVLESPLTTAPEAPLSYSIIRNVGTITLSRISGLPGNGFVADASGITLPASLTSGGYPLVAGSVEAGYRALRNDLAAEVKSYDLIADIISTFGGADQITPANPLAYALQIMLQNTTTQVNGLGLSEIYAQDETTAFVASLEPLAMTEMYAIAVLSKSPVVHTTFKNHVEQMSLPNSKLERIALINSQLITVLTLQDESTTSANLAGARTIVATQIAGQGAIANPATLIDGVTDQFLNVHKGDSVVILSGTNVTPGTYLVATVTDNNHLVLSSNFIVSGSPVDIVYYIQRKDGVDADGLRFYDRNASFLTNGVAAGHYVNILSGSLAGRWRIATIVNEKELVLSTAIAGVVSVTPSVNYLAERDLTKNEQADLVAGYSEALGSRRVIHTWPDVVSAPYGQEIVDLEGFYVGAAIAALVTGLPTQQGFTNLAISGFLGFKHSTRYFTPEQLNTIANGGTMIMEQDGPQQALYVRHQLTTDRSAIKFQELSVTKNVDFIAKFLRTSYKAYPGAYNIVDTTMDELKAAAAGCITFLRDNTKQPKIGGVIRSGELKSIEESTTQIDTVNMRFGFNIPIPLNNLDITIEV
jgi:hypothetical protein